MTKHSSYTYHFRAKINKNKQRYYLTFPKPMGESYRDLKGDFKFNHKTREIIFSVSTGGDPLILINKRDKARIHYDE